MTPIEIKQARQRFGLSAQKFAKLFGLQTGRSVFCWESGEAVVPAPVELLLRAADEVPGMREWLEMQA